MKDSICLTGVKTGKAAPFRIKPALAPIDLSAPSKKAVELGWDRQKLRRLLRAFDECRRLRLGSARNKLERTSKNGSDPARGRKF